MTDSSSSDPSPDPPNPVNQPDSLDRPATSDQPAAAETPGASLGASPSGAVDLTGQAMGDYQILRRLGRGGMADVYVAQQKSLGRQVAIKILRRDFAQDASYVERFRREARAVARLSHANIVQVFEVGQRDDLHYIVQEFVDGSNLREKLQREGVLSIGEATRVLVGVTDALIAAEEAGITHRDIKPENIMLSRRGAVKVADFGLARVRDGGGLNDLTQVGLTMGTPRYMSPEQVQGKTVDIRSDLYSLGVTMFHLLTGRPPFEADEPLALAVKHLHDAPPDLATARAGGDLPDWLAAIIRRLLEKPPEGRFASANALADAIRKGLSESSPTLAENATQSLSATLVLQAAVDQATQRGRRHLWRYAGLWLLPLVGLLAGAAWAARRPAPTLERLLRADTFEVTEMESVAAQYLEAARLDQPSGWRAVWKYFPPEQSEVNADYAVKAKLQLARLYRRRGEPALALEQLEQLNQNAEIGQLYQALALAMRIDILEEDGEVRAADALRSTLEATYRQLVLTNPTHLELFRSKAPRAIVDRLTR